ncbi:hypothetical protein CIHG_08306 [Coccidioides immitis H538.4]|uniref:Uncharacterized protein n=1 Tax=Coccidioides immitis H538.4 TaxID=396776 RepID=A0A0J8RZH6_COCIT|nr:hypothetical protein CIHG_08306 [Coccidioides immitis H538.4]
MTRSSCMRDEVSLTPRGWVETDHKTYGAAVGALPVQPVPSQDKGCRRGPFTKGQFETDSQHGSGIIVPPSLPDTMRPDPRYFPVKSSGPSEVSGASETDDHHEAEHEPTSPLTLSHRALVFFTLNYLRNLAPWSKPAVPSPPHPPFQTPPSAVNSPT